MTNKSVMKLRRPLGASDPWTRPSTSTSHSSGGSHPWTHGTLTACLDGGFVPGFEKPPDLFSPSPSKPVSGCAKSKGDLSSSRTPCPPLPGFGNDRGTPCR
ncbi:hypothetical protein RHMOL_Rhmol08G0179900 [Rhododendron molle]|uniref:Uncharacterized protein n=1 Tax=Rhododendron molle TaxID=49168 RepID=A0ACC0MRM6_RHOML|nr:hypothetical protein RHMOL_Rhmol08G0179900 [Rhododendron molle]